MISAWVSRQKIVPWGMIICPHQMAVHYSNWCQSLMLAQRSGLLSGHVSRRARCSLGTLLDAFRLRCHSCNTHTNKYYSFLHDNISLEDQHPFLNLIKATWERMMQVQYQLLQTLSPEYLFSSVAHHLYSVATNWEVKRKKSFLRVKLFTKTLSFQNQYCIFLWNSQT